MHQRISLLLFGMCCYAQTLTLSAPANVPSGQPVTVTVTYTGAGALYDDITWATQPPPPVPSGVAVSWVASAVLTPAPNNGPLVIADGVVGIETLILPDGIWDVRFDSPVGIGADGSSGPVASNTVTITVGTVVVPPSSVSATAN